jgi:hypothetical protein
MAQFTVQWNNSDITANPSNNTNQRVSYRQKSVGGAWLTAGFSPTNDMSPSVTSASSPTLTSNLVYEFKHESICTQNGPVINDNGVQEQIGFTCIVPSIGNTDRTSTITLTLTGTDITKVNFTLRRSSNNSVVYGPIVVNRVGNLAQAVAASLDPSTNYYWQVSLVAVVNGQEVNSASSAYLNSICGPYTATTSAPPVQNLIWIPQNFACETEGGFDIERTISGLSSPAKAWYDPINHLVYVADYDDPLGNVYWFNPNVATIPSDMVHSTVVNDNQLYNNYIDPVYRRIYFVGANSGGLISYDIDTNTKTIVPFGTNALFSRISLTVTNNFIYCNDGTTSIVIINRNNLTINSTVTVGSIPIAAHFNLDATLIEGNGKMYVLNNNNTGIGTIGIYNYALTTHIGEITLSGAATWSGGNNGFWQTGFYDVTSNKLYVGDIGSSKRFIIDTTTDTVIHTQTLLNRSGKSNAASSWTINPVTNELMFLFTATNNVTDNATIRRAYKEDRVTHLYTRMFENQSYSNLTAIGGTNEVVGMNPGQVYWNGNPAYSTDGTIMILSTSLGSDRTGVKIITTLQQVDANNGNTPTGVTKNNSPSDLDYVQPTVDLTTCSVAVSLDCPVDLVTTFAGTSLEYEFSIATSVRNNTAIKKIQVFAFNTNTASIEGAPIEVTAPFSSNFFSNEFVGLGGSNYTIQIKYLDVTNAILSTC